MWGQLIVIALVLAVLLVGAELYSMKQKIAVGQNTAENTMSFSRDDAGVPTMLVLGDSTAVGVGADTPADSVAGRIAVQVHAPYVENHAVSGAQVHDLPSQIALARKVRYDIILVMIGGNDIIRFHPAASNADALSEILKTLPQASTTILVSAANVGGSTLFPRVVRPVHTWLNQAYHREFAARAQQLGITYVNLSVPRGEDPFLKDPSRYLAPDGLHPSSAGYGLWADAIIRSLGL